jgi:hypothetical protein
MTTTSAPSTAAPSLQQMQSLFDRYGDAWASRNAGVIAPFHAEDGVFHLHAAAGRIEIDAADVITVSDGLLTAKHTYVDWAAGLQQLGLA